MALPLLKDFLSQEGLHASLPEVAALGHAVERFAAVIREALPSLSEDDLVSAYEQIQTEDEANRQRKSSLTRARALQMCDREILLLKRTIAAFERAKEQMETLRDAVLVREAQEFSGRAFWGEDDE